MSLKIEEYAILSDDTTAGLVTQINTYISRGWIPYGGITFNSLDDRGVAKASYSQAIVKPSGR